MANTFKVLFVGMGSIGKRHLKNLHTLAKQGHFQVEAEALRHTSVPMSADIQPLLTRQITLLQQLQSCYDAIFITNPSHLHYETLVHLQPYTQCFFIEKPLHNTALTPQQRARLATDKLYYVACPLRHTTVFKQLQAFLTHRSVISVRAICSSYLPDWRPGTDYRTTYAAQAQNGGIKLDLIHEFDYLFTLFGFPAHYTLEEKKLSNLEINAPDFVHFTAQYPHTYLELHLDYFGRIAQRRCEVYTNDETIICDFNHSTLQVNDIMQTFTENLNQRYLQELTYFLTLIHNRQTNMNDINRANSVLQFITAGGNTK